MLIVCSPITLEDIDSCKEPNFGDGMLVGKTVIFRCVPALV